MNVRVVERDADWFKETFDELEFLRSEGKKLLDSGKLPVITPIYDDICRLWDDYDRYQNPVEQDDPEGDAKKFIEKNYNFLSRFYPVNIANTLDFWYYVWTDLFIDFGCPVESLDYQIYFTLLRPTHSDYPFKATDGIFVPRINKYCFIKMWSKRITRDVRKAKLDKLMKDPETLERCKRGDFHILPEYYPLENRDIFVAYTKRLLKENDTEHQREMRRASQEKQRERHKLAAQILRLQQEGYTIEGIENGQLILTK